MMCDSRKLYQYQHLTLVPRFRKQLRNFSSSFVDKLPNHFQPEEYQRVDEENYTDVMLLFSVLNELSVSDVHKLWTVFQIKISMSEFFH